VVSFIQLVSGGARSASRPRARGWRLLARMLADYGGSLAGGWLPGAVPGSTAARFRTVRART
jgi:energy-converting hydrogenase Eha subunit B